MTERGLNEVSQIEDIIRYPRLDPREDPMPVPSANIGDAPQRRLCVSQEWVKHLVGVIGRLTRADAWTGDPDSVDWAINQVDLMLAQLGQDVECTEVITVVETVTEVITEVIGGGGAAFGGDEMPCISVADLVKIEGGILYARNSCCEWVEVGAIGSQTENPPDSIPWEDPTIPYSACGKAASLVNAIAAVLQAAIDNHTNEATYEAAVRAAIPEITMGRAQIWAMYTQLGTLAELYNWSEDVIYDELIQVAICKAVVGMDADSAEGSDAEVDYVLNSIKSAISDERAGLNVDVIFGVWLRAAEIIGENDRKFLLARGAQDFDTDCSCPDDDGTETWPIEEDWYIAYSFQGTHPSYWTLGSSNGNTIITARGAELEAQTSGSDEVSLTWNPPVTTGTITRVKLEMLINDVVCQYNWTGLGLQLASIGNYLQDDLVGVDGIYTYLNESCSATPAGWYASAEINASDTLDPMAVVFARIILAGSGAHPLGL